MQMRYGSIGWSVGALLGYQMGMGKEKRVVACIGDGSFQMTAQVRHMFVVLCGLYSHVHGMFTISVACY